MANSARPVTPEKDGANMLRTVLILSLLTVTACTARVHGEPDVRVKGDGYTVEIGDGHHNGKFCPPGHAKKGWC